MPVNFTCPYCGAFTVVADQFAGSSGPCGKCGQTIRIPGAPQAVADAAPQNSNKTWMIIGIFAGVFVVFLICGGALGALLGPAFQAARESSRKVTCAHNLKQIAVAMLQYETENRKYLPAYIADKNGRPMHSWRVLLLPYLGANDLYAQYDFNEPWDGPNNRRLAAKMPSVFRCPSDSKDKGFVTDYLVITGPGTMFNGGKSMTIAGIRDGPSNTIMIVEVSGADIHWMEPRDLDFSTMSFSTDPKPGEGLQSPHRDGSHVAFADARVAFLSEWDNFKNLKAYITVNGQEPVYPQF